MDGNGRWAHARGLTRLEGHRRGADAVLRAVQTAPSLGITDLTLYAFSSDNWRRPAEESSGLMRLFGEFLDRETARCLRESVRLLVVGRRDRLPATLRAAIRAAERTTEDCSRLTLRLAVDYSARYSILRAAAASPANVEDLTGLPDVDLLIRTGGEQRLSDFLLWECAYAELCFLPVLWPDFNETHLTEAVDDFRKRQRRFGALPAGYCGIPA
jgi:undecaprenyl diphosphate synthase